MNNDEYADEIKLGEYPCIDSEIIRPHVITLCLMVEQKAKTKHQEYKQIEIRPGCSLFVHLFNLIKDENQAIFNLRMADKEEKEKEAMKKLINKHREEARNFLDSIEK